MSTVVLFNHPGPEHVAKGRGGLYPWNVAKAHKRKYLSVRAQVAERDGNSFRRGQEERRVALWAEFEPPTTGTRFDGSAIGGLPESWHTLVPIPVPLSADAQNTDPWIFGESFRYSYCKQVHKPFLRDLEQGDLLLFGSYKELDADGKPAPVFNFFLDTVFVVESFFPLHSPAAIPQNLFDPVYRRAAYDRWSDDRDDCTFYKGAMLGDEPSTAQFCYSPCAPYQGDSPHRVPRPMINDLFGVTTRNPQLFARVCGFSPEQAWRMVTARCLDRGYRLAVRVEDAVVAPGSETISEPIGPRALVVHGSRPRRPGSC